jgi:hypothetical protein
MVSGGDGGGKSDEQPPRKDIARADAKAAKAGATVVKPAKEARRALRAVLFDFIGKNSIKGSFTRSGRHGRAALHQDAGVLLQSDAEAVQ